MKVGYANYPPVLFSFLLTPLMSITPKPYPPSGCLVPTEVVSCSTEDRYPSFLKTGSCQYKTAFNCTSCIQDVQLHLVRKLDHHVSVDSSILSTCMYTVFRDRTSVNPHPALGAFSQKEPGRRGYLVATNNEIHLIQDLQWLPCWSLPSWRCWCCHRSSEKVMPRTAYPTLLKPSKAKVLKSYLISYLDTIFFF